MSDFERLVPKSIYDDNKIQALAKGAGEQLDTHAALTQFIYIYSRLDEISEGILDHLAWQFHVDGYGLAKDAEEKRSLIKEFYNFHRYKGTVHGLKLFVKHLLKRELLKAEPPHKSFIGTTLTDEERKRFEALMPEIRVYPYCHKGVKASFFCGDCVGDPAQDWGVFPAQTDALLRIGDLVELYDPVTNGTTPLNYFKIEKEWVEKKATDTIEIRLKSTAHGIFCGDVLYGYTVNEGADKRLYTVRFERKYQEEYERRIPLSIQPSLTPVRSYYEIEQQPGNRGYATFLANRYDDLYRDTGGSYLKGAYTAATDVYMRIYKKLKLFDPERAQLFTGHKATSFLGAFRIGELPAHYARIAIDMQGKKPRKCLHCAGFVGEYFYKSDASDRISIMRDVVKMSARLSDKILVSIKNRRPVRAMQIIKAGSTRAGEYRLEVI